MLKEFKEFAFKGNVFDLAIAVIIGAAFGKIVAALVDNIFMPLIGLLLGGINFANLAIKVGDAQIKYGAFIQAVIDFIIVAFVIFLIVKGINRTRRKQEAEVATAPEPSEEILLLREIRDSLKAPNTP